MAGPWSVRGASFSELCGRLFGGEFLPHGHCYYFQADVLWLNIVSDALIGLSYFSIPVGLVYFASKRRGLAFGNLLWLFGSFIMLCGLTHVLEIYNIWHGAYYLSGTVKAATGLVSMATAVTLIRGLPFALKIPMPSELMNAERARAVAEERLLDREDLLEAILKGGPSAFVLTRARRAADGSMQDLRIEEANERAADWFDMSRSELASKRFRDLLPAEVGEELYAQCREAWERKRPALWEAEVDRLVWAEFRVVPVSEYLAVSWTDITERKRNEAELRRMRGELEKRVSDQDVELWRSEQRHRLLTEFVNDVIWQTDATGHVVDPMPTWERFTGQRFEEYRGFGWLAMYDSKERDIIMTKWQESLLHGSSFTFEARLWSSALGDYASVVARGIPLRSETGEVIEWIGGVADITQLKANERQLKQLAARLEAKNRHLESFTYLASHDLQEPLRKIRAFGDILRQDFGDRLGSEAASYIEVMQASAARMARLVEDLRVYSLASTQEIDTVELDLNVALDEALEDLELAIREAEAKIERGPLPVVQGDEGQFRHLFQNLVGNALKYRDKERPLRIEITSEPVEPAAVPDFPERDPRRSYVAVRVADNGIGFEQKYAEKIFSPFQRLHGRGKYSGSGMGLSICLQIAQRHKGAIVCAGELGRGAVFTLYLPK